jgi:hypothetical protein
MIKVFRPMLAGLALVALPANPVQAAGEILITHTKALAGGVTPGDAPGYPVTLTLPGAYQLASNLSVSPGKDGIWVQSTDVTLDLNGFRISGGPAGGTLATNGRYGVYGLGDRFTVKNGTIGAFATAGVWARNRAFTVADAVRVVNCAGTGIDVAQSSVATIRNSVVASNGLIGIYCGHDCHVESSNVARNGSRGVFLLSGTAFGNTITRNGDGGIFIVPGGTAGVGNNTVTHNAFFNISGNRINLQPNACAPVAC